MKFIKRLFNNDYAFSFINKITSVLIGIITSSLNNRFLGVEGKGEYAFVINIVNLVIIAGNFGFFQSYPNSKRNKMPNITEKYIDVFFTQFLIYVLIATGLSFACGGNALYICALFLVPIQVLTAQFGMVILVEFFSFNQKLQFVTAFLNLLLTVLVFLFAPRHAVFIMALLLLRDLFVIVMYLIKTKYIPRPFRVEGKFLRYLFRFGFVAMISAFLLTLNYKADVIMLKFYVDDAQIGLYSVGVMLAEYIWIIPDAFKDVLFSRTAKDDSIDEIMSSIRINLYVTLFIMGGLVLLGRPFINLMYGSDFLGAYGVTCLIMCGVPAMVLYKMTNSLYVANGKQMFYLITLAISAVSNIILNIIFIPMFSMMGAAIASAISYNICGFIFFGRFMHDYNIKWYEAFMLRKKDIMMIIKKNKK